MLGITIIIIIALAVWGSFAFFAAATSATNELTVNITIGSTGDDVTFTSSLNTAASINVTSDSMLYGNAGTVAASASPKMNVSLKSKQPVVCTYDIVWKWLDDGDHYSLTDDGENEFVASGADSNDAFGNTQLNDYGSDTLVKRGAIITADNGTTSEIWTFIIKFNNINRNQDYHAGNTYKGYFTTENVECEEDNPVY